MIIFKCRFRVNFLQPYFFWVDLMPMEMSPTYFSSRQDHMLCPLPLITVGPLQQGVVIFYIGTALVSFLHLYIYLTT